MRRQLTRFAKKYGVKHIYDSASMTSVSAAGLWTRFNIALPNRNSLVSRSSMNVSSFVT